MKDACNTPTNNITIKHFTSKSICTSQSANATSATTNSTTASITNATDSPYNNHSAVLIVAASTCQIKQFQQSVNSVAPATLVTTNGKSAQQVIKQNSPTIIVIAEQLADMPGIHLCQWLLQHRDNSHPSIILVSDSYPDISNITEHIDWVPLQHQPTLLHQIVRNHLTTHQLKAVLEQSQQHLIALQAHLDHAIDARSQQQIKERDAVIFSLAKLVEAKDNETGSHLERISQYAEILAIAFKNPKAGRNQQWIDHIKATAILHDIGKIGIPDQILRKPAKLSAEERSIMNQHPLIGGQALRDISAKVGDANYLQIAADIAEAHHEKWDGSGYPRGLSGHNIPLAARLVAVADVYDALRSSRVYKAPLDHEVAKAFILAESGKHFDPEVVAVFLNHEAQFAQVANELQE